MKIAITGGHITPALAVIQELQKNNKNKIIFFGRKYSFEGDKTLSNDYLVVSKIKGIKYIDLETGRLQRNFSHRTIPSLLKIPRGFWQAYQDLKSNKPDVVLSFGGYLAVPVITAAWLQKIPVVTHEQTVVVGLSNRIVSFFARRILVTWPSSLKHFPAKKTKVLGNPIREEIFVDHQVKVNGKKKGVKGFINRAIKKGKGIVYITGGNQGSQIINKNVWEILPELLKDYYIIHQCGGKDWERLENKKVTLNLQKKDFEKYFIAPWIDSQDVGLVLNSADLVISRAGANTVYELAALGKPSLFIPISWVVHNEQQKNAEILSNAGVARILSENSLQPWKLKKVMDEMFEELDKYQIKGAELKKEIKLNAAEKIVEEVKSLISNV